jgi:hypothetical protein
MLTRRALFSGIFALPLLAACATVNLGEVQKFLAAVQVEVQKYCGVIVPIADISVLVTGGSTIAMTASAWAHAICDAVAQQQPQLLAAKRRGLRAAPEWRTVIVNGVPIHVR